VAWTTSSVYSVDGRCRKVYDVGLRFSDLDTSDLLRFDVVLLHQTLHRIKRHRRGIFTGLADRHAKLTETVCVLAGGDTIVPF